MAHTTDKIFVSYSRHDEAFARKMAIWMAKTLNLGVWIDVDDIQPGVKWSAAIQDGLDNCEVMVVIVTPEAMQSVNVEDEWQYFIDLGKPVVPILLRSAPIPYQLRRIQYIDFSVREEYNESLRLLIVELRRHLKPLNSAEREANQRSTQTAHSVHNVTSTKKAVRAKERMEKAEDLLTRQEKALARNNWILGFMGFLVFGLAAGFGGFAYWVYINQPQLFYIRNAPSDAVAYLPNAESGVPVSSLENGQAPEGTRFETNEGSLELSSSAGAEAVIQPNSSATIGDFNEENVEFTLQEGNVSLDTAGTSGEIITPNGISISAQQNIEVEVDAESNEVSANCFEGTCTISDQADGRSRELEEGSTITFSSTARDFDTAEVLSIPGAIAFSSFRHGAAELYLMTPQGTNQTRITQNTGVRDQSPTWSPDGTRIAFVTDRNGSYDIAVISSLGVENTVEILTGDSRRTEQHPAWSPDGTRIAFESDRDGNDEIYVMNADGTNVIRLTDNSASDTAPTWSADGSQIAFVSSRTGDPEIFIMTLNDLESEPVNISLNPAIDEEPAWSPDGTRIAYTSHRDSNEEIYVFTIGQEPDSAVNITNNSGNDFEAAWSPDSSRLLFTTQRFGNNDIALINADGTGEVVNLSGVDNTADEEAAWLPIIRAGQ
jgi:dipeptidyl aminopeptidase/acylaminoacyl peptidase